MGFIRNFSSVLLCLGATGLAPSASAAGTLQAMGTTTTPPVLVDHVVDVVLNNGFARTEVTQRFRNPGTEAVDAIYEFPVPKAAALSAMTITIGERTLRGEVLPKADAAAIYEERAASGDQAGLATQNGYKTFQFDIANIPAGGEATMSFVYYEALAIESAVGRYLYPLEDGGTEDASERSFWTREETITGTFTFDLELKSAVAVEELRLPDLAADVVELGPGHYTVHVEAQQATLNQDIVFYYRLPDDEPGQVALIPYRPASGGPGTFLLLVTPGTDLRPIESGRDVVYVLDVSGSMDGKLATLRDAVGQALGTLTPRDRFRLIAFDDFAWELTSGYCTADAEGIADGRDLVDALTIGGSTNLYAGLEAALANIASDRISEVILVTDGVTNTGVVEPVGFVELLRESDLRVFSFLLGNSANWPLMEIITETSGGFYAPISNNDDILGQILLADGKLTHESLHDSRLTVSGLEVLDTTDFDFGKIYRGQQLVVFGRYDDPGAATLSLDARLSGREISYSTRLNLPESDDRNPELERLWALEMIHAVQKQRLLGLMGEEEASAKIEALGVAYQLVTEETSMLVVDDAVFDELGIDRDNLERTTVEANAQAVRAREEPTDYAVDSGSFGSSSPSSRASSSSGSSDDDDDYAAALDPWALLLGSLVIPALWRRPRRGRASAV